MKLASGKTQAPSMKKYLFSSVAAAMLLAAGTASAAPMYLDLGVIDPSSPNKYDAARSTGAFDANSTTGQFTEFGFSQLLATSLYDFSDGSVLGSFFDTNDTSILNSYGVPASGTALDGTSTVQIDLPNCAGGQCDIDALSPLAPPLASDSEGFLQTWDLQVVYNLEGNLTAAGPAYTGGTFEVYFRSLIGQQFVNGELVTPPSLDNQLVIKGQVTGSDLQAANLNLFFDVEYALDGFLFVDSGSGTFIDAGLQDLESGSTSPVRLILDTNVNPPVPTPDQLLLVNSDNGLHAVRQTTLDGSVTAQVPEPGTLALLGLGIVGLGASLARRRRTI